jgi:hypothetical protein
MYRTTPKVVAGLGAVRPAWCPGTSLKPGQRDPCEIEYAFDLPIVGKTTFGLPIPAMTNDALLTVQQRLPEVLDQSLPVVYQKLQPYIDDLTEFVIPGVVDTILKKQVVPMIENQKAEIIAQADLVVQKALLGIGIVAAAGLGIYWYIRKTT